MAERLPPDLEWFDRPEPRRKRARRALELVEEARRAYPPEQGWRSVYEVADTMGLKPDTIRRYLQHPEGAPSRRRRVRKPGEKNEE
jgi:hypothetical protein